MKGTRDLFCQPDGKFRCNNEIKTSEPFALVHKTTAEDSAARYSLIASVSELPNLVGSLSERDARVRILLTKVLGIALVWFIKKLLCVYFCQTSNYISLQTSVLTNEHLAGRMWPVFVQKSLSFNRM